jgi:hypothetical protein
MNEMTSGTFQAGSSAGAAVCGDCDDAVVAAPIDIASNNESAIFRMCHPSRLFGLINGRQNPKQRKLACPWLAN